MMTNRAVLPEFRDRVGTLFLPVRRNADGSTEYRRAAEQDQRAAARERPAPHTPAENASLLADRLRALGYGKKPPAAPANGDREALSLDGLKRFQRALALAR